MTCEGRKDKAVKLVALRNRLNNGYIYQGAWLKPCGTRFNVDRDSKLSRYIKDEK